MTRPGRKRTPVVWNRSIVLLFSVPICVFASILAWALLTGNWSIPVIGAVAASGSAVVTEFAAYLLWSATVPASLEDPVTGHDDWMKEGGM